MDSKVVKYVKSMLARGSKPSALARLIGCNVDMIRFWAGV